MPLSVTPGPLLVPGPLSLQTLPELSVRLPPDQRVTLVPLADTVNVVAASAADLDVVTSMPACAAGIVEASVGEGSWPPPHPARARTARVWAIASDRGVNEVFI